MGTVHDDKPEPGVLAFVREVPQAPLPSSPTPSIVSSSPRTLPWPLPAWPLGWQFVDFPACLGVQRPEPALILGAAAVFVYPADTPLAAEDAVVDAVLVDAVAKAGRAHRERHQMMPGL